MRFHVQVTLWPGQEELLCRGVTRTQLQLLSLSIYYRSLSFEREIITDCLSERFAHERRVSAAVLYTSLLGGKDFSPVGGWAH